MFIITYKHFFIYFSYIFIEFELTKHCIEMRISLEHVVGITVCDMILYIINKYLYLFIIFCANLIVKKTLNRNANIAILSSGNNCMWKVVSNYNRLILLRIESAINHFRWVGTI
jgi:hypothetical protein